MVTTQAVFFDRDGTLGDNANAEYPTQLTPFDFVGGVFAEIKRAGIKVFIFTNQSCIARGKDGGYDFAAEFLGCGADDWFICPHDAADNCDCRKPKSGLLLAAQQKYGLDLTRCLVVGDRMSDMLAGLNVGTRAALVLTGRGGEASGSREYADLQNRIAVVPDIRGIPSLLG
jgi:histidinol-phosphate phosphatase family protein